MTTLCPSCGCTQPDGLLCHECTSALETMLAAVPQLVEQLNVAISKQARVATGGKSGKGSAHEKSPINFGAMDVRDTLVVRAKECGTDIDAIRRHPDAATLLVGIGKAVKNAYRVIDRMQERQYLGKCLYREDALVCHAEIWVKPGAHQVTCSQCETTHDVPARRAALLDQAKDQLVTAKEASRYMGEVGHITVTEASIRGYIHRKRIAYRPGGNLIRLGDLMAVVLDDSEKKSA